MDSEKADQSGRTAPGAVDSNVAVVDSDGNTAREDVSEFRRSGVIISTLDSHKATNKQEVEIIANTIEGLFTYNEDHTIRNGLCESYEMSEDGMEYIFHLRRDSRWSNGDSVTAHDFVYGWNRPASRFNNDLNPPVITYSKIKNSSEITEKEEIFFVKELGVEALNDYTLKVQMEAPNSYLITLLARPYFAPVNQKFAEALGEDYGTSVDALLCNGPYVLSEWAGNTHTVLRKNPNYYDSEEVALEKVYYRTISANIGLSKIYGDEEVDYLELGKDGYERFADHPDAQIIPELKVSLLTFHISNPVLENQNVRKAIAYGFDKARYVDEFFERLCTPMDNLIPYGFVYDRHGRDFRNEPVGVLKYDVDKARAYWEKAKEELQLDTYEINMIGGSSEKDMAMGEYIKDELESNLEGLTINVLKTSFSSHSKDLEIYENGFIGKGLTIQYYTDPLAALESLVSEKDGVPMNYTNDEFDTIIADAQGGVLFESEEARLAALKEAEQIIVEDAVYLIPLYQHGRVILSRPSVKGMDCYSVKEYALYRYVQVD